MSIKFHLTYLANPNRPGYDVDEFIANVSATIGHVRPRSTQIRIVSGKQTDLDAINRRLRKRHGAKAALSKAESMYEAHHEARGKARNSINIVLESHERFRGDPSGIMERFKSGAYGDADGLSCPMVALTGVHGTQYRRTDAAWAHAYVCRIWLPKEDRKLGDLIETADLVSCWGSSWHPIAARITSDGWRPELAFALEHVKRSGIVPHGAKVVDLPILGNLEAKPVPAEPRAIVVISDYELPENDPIRSVATAVEVIEPLEDGQEDDGFSAALVSKSITFMTAYRNALIVPVQKDYWTRQHSREVAVAVSRAALSADNKACVWRGGNMWPVFWALNSLVIPIGPERPSLDGSIDSIAKQFEIDPVDIEVNAVGIHGAIVRGVNTSKDHSDRYLQAWKLYTFDGLAALAALTSNGASEDKEVLDALLWAAFAARYWCVDTLALVVQLTEAGALSPKERETIAIAWLMAMLKAPGIAPLLDVHFAANLVEAVVGQAVVPSAEGEDASDRQDTSSSDAKASDESEA